MHNSIVLEVLKKYLKIRLPNSSKSHLLTSSSQSVGLSQSSAGFTMIELIGVVVMIGILGAIAAPGWLGFVNRQRVNKANDVVLVALREAQREAKRTKRDYSVSFRTDADIPQIAIHQGTTPSNWRNLGEDVGIKAGEVLLSNIESDDDPQTITFDYMGTLPNADFGTPPDGSTEAPGLKIVVAVPDSNIQRCVIVKTLLGSMLTEKDDQCDHE